MKHDNDYEVGALEGTIENLKAERDQERNAFINEVKKNNRLKEQLEAYKMEAEEGKEINAELKAENDEYSLFIEKLCDYAGLECDDEEQAMRTLYDLASQMNKARWIIDKHKQTLTEIKEIAQNGCYDDCGMPLDELSIILQKISECEGNDE